jgi:hypothetical protein
MRLICPTMQLAHCTSSPVAPCAGKKSPLALLLSSSPHPCPPSSHLCRISAASVLPWVAPWPVPPWTGSSTGPAAARCVVVCGWGAGGGGGPGDGMAAQRHHAPCQHTCNAAAHPWSPLPPICVLGNPCGSWHHDCAAAEPASDPSLCHTTNCANTADTIMLCRPGHHPMCSSPAAAADCALVPPSTPHHTPCPPLLQLFGLWVSDGSGAARLLAADTSEEAGSWVAVLTGGQVALGSRYLVQPAALLGEGVFARVVAATDLASGSRCAIKVSGERGERGRGREGAPGCPVSASPALRPAASKPAMTPHATGDHSSSNSHTVCREHGTGVPCLIPPPCSLPSYTPTGAVPLHVGGVWRPGGEGGAHLVPVGASPARGGTTRDTRGTPRPGLCVR